MDRLEAMRAFVAAAEFGSFSRAAAELGVRQSIVSKWVAFLEQQLEVELITRTTRRQQLTDVGRSFLDECRQVLEAYDAALTHVKGRAERPAGRLRVSVPVVFGQRFLVSKLPEFAGRFPQIQLDVRFSDDYVDLIGERIDVAVRVGLALDSGLRSRRLGSSERWLVGSKAYLERYGIPKRPEQLSEHRCLLYSGAPVRSLWRFGARGRMHDVSVAGPLTANNSLALCEFAVQGQGLALLADWVVDEHVACGRLVRVLANFQAPPAQIQALLPVARHVPAKSRAFIDFVAETLEPLGRTKSSEVRPGAGEAQPDH